MILRLKIYRKHNDEIDVLSFVRFALWNQDIKLGKKDRALYAAVSTTRENVRAWQQVARRCLALSTIEAAAAGGRERNRRRDIVSWTFCGSGNNSRGARGDVWLYLVGIVAIKNIII